MFDLHCAIRRFNRHTGFTLAAAGTLAVGIAVTTTGFSLAEGVLLRPPPYPEPDRLVTIVSAGRTGSAGSPGCHADQWLRWREEADAFESMSGYTWAFDFLVSTDGSESVEGMHVTPDFFRTIGLHPLLGREFVRADCATTNQPPLSVILGHSLWRRRFGGNASIIGQTIELGRAERPLTVVGVMPPGVRFLPAPTAIAEPNYDPDKMVDYWIPVWPEGVTINFWSVVGRLKPQSTRAQAQAQLDVIAAVQAQSDPRFERITARLQPLLSELNREGRRLLLPMMGAVAVVFLIACANVSGLLLVRGLRRQTEFAVRCALGASRPVIVNQVIRESLPLGVMGGMLGIGFTVALVRLLRSLGAEIIPRVDAVTIDWAVLMFCVLISATAAMAASLLPAYRASRAAPVEALKADGLTTGTHRTERLMLEMVAGTQIALTIGLMVGAGLLLRTVNRLLAVEPGFETANILTMSVTVPAETKWLDFHTRAMEQVASIPGVLHAAFAWGVPLTGNHWRTTYEVVGQSAPRRPIDWAGIQTRTVTPDYFAAMGMRIIEGRTFRREERWDEIHSITNVPWVVIVNEAFVKEQFSGSHPLGRKLRFGNRPDYTAEIIGVVSDTRTGSLDRVPTPELYFTFWQQFPFTKHLIARTAANPRAMTGAITDALREVDPTVAIENVKTMEELRDASISPQRFVARMLTGLALIAGLLAAVGVYDVMAHSVASRRREIAIRISIGAKPRDVLAAVLRDAVRLTIAGLVMGMIAAVILGRILQGLVFGAETFDPLTYGVVLTVATALAVLASWIPARRAIHTAPMTVLRGE